MECPKCKAQNPDDAVCCSLCFEMFKAKPKSAAPPSAKKIAFAETSTVHDTWWNIAGPLAISENGLYFFVKTMVYTKQSMGDIAARQGAQQGGLLGGLIGAAVGAAIDGASGSAPGRPSKLDIKPTRDIVEQCAEIIQYAPDIPSCKEFFDVPKKDITKIEFGFWGGMTVTTAYLNLAVSGVKPEEKASAFFKLKGYPFSE